MKTRRKAFLILLIACICITNGLMAQSTMKVRIAKIVVDSAYLTEYRAALAEHAATAVKVEPGVLTLNAVYDKQKPLTLLCLKYMLPTVLIRHILRHLISSNTKQVL